MYVNDAFGTAHRAHASTTVAARFFKEKGAGLLMEKELRSLDRVLHNPPHPVIAIIGGAKVSDKIGLLRHLIKKVDSLLIGGGMSHTFVHAMGGEVGSSLLESSGLEAAKSLSEQAISANTRLELPTDAITAEQISSTSTIKVRPATKIPTGWKGLDIGPETLARFNTEIRYAKTLIWNGPMGVAELPAFAKGTRGVAEALAEVSEQPGVFSLVGGGDSVAAIKALGLGQKISHLSTGGGALLTALEGKGLPALQALDT